MHTTATAILLAIAALATSVAPACAEPAAEQWEMRFHPDRTTPVTNVTFSLFNHFDDQEVRYGERDHGINLVWSTGTRREWSLIELGAETTPLRRNRRYALYNTTRRAYVRYGERDSGINLVWSSAPTFEWFVVDFDTPRSPVPRAGRDALYNETAGDYVIYGSRRCGINLMWSFEGNAELQPPWSAFSPC